MWRRRVGVRMVAVSEGVGETLRARPVAVRASLPCAATTIIPRHQLATTLARSASLTSFTSRSDLREGLTPTLRLTAIPASALAAQDQLTARYPQDSQRPPP
ncbi:MAG TPA: hypothetical protein VMV29_06240 [Ktedonobacterales bacterium]|nr:hypothetical protein [Ktedonobacterales bacterium]